MSDSSTACVFSFSAEGGSRFSPQLTLHFVDGTTQVHGETFALERQQPSLAFQNVGFQLINGKQNLTVSVTAVDDSDISSVGFSVTGIRASDLRAAGGVVDQARNKAFAQTSGTVIINPSYEGQTEFVLLLPLANELDAAAIAHDGLVLLDLVAVDASGNQNALSKIAFTGSDVSEQAESIQVAPQRIVFTNLLETATLMPSVDFQFRGLTALPGAGSGVTYTSSHPDLIAVTTGGVVYPLAETGDQAVTITVAYPGLVPLVVPVDVDLTKVIDHLAVDAIDEHGHFVLNSLNTPTALPPVYAVFNDGSRTDVGSQFPLTYSLPASAQGVMSLNARHELTAQAIVPDTAPINLHVALANHSSVALELPVVAHDALPEVILNVPDSVQAGETLSLVAQPRDDVAIREVRFLLDGAIVGVRRQVPYTVGFTTSEQMVNRNLVFTAVAIDSAGQSNGSIAKTVRVVAEPQANLPDLDFELPADLQRFVEGTPLRLQLTTPLQGDTSEISYVDFYMDGRRIGAAHYPLMEERQMPTGMQFFELWRFDGAAPMISTQESSISVYAEVHTRNGASKALPAKLIRILENRPPVAMIVAPVAGASVSVGQTLEVQVEIADDTLPIGTDVALTVNDAEIGRIHHQDFTQRFAGSFDIQNVRKSFTVPVTEEQLGGVLTLRAEVVDYHESVAFSEPLRIPVHEDEPPSVALNHPVAGAHFVAGLPIELRAQAADDVGVARVDFYANGALVGSDARAPYTLAYEPPAVISHEQVLRLQAEAVDTQGQATRGVEIEVTLGLDEEPPVVNLVSPIVSGTEGGAELAEVIEDSEIVIKASGYDNVGVDRLELRGIRRNGTAYELTGNPADSVSGEEFAPEQIPGAMRAFSALKLVRVPLFSHAAGAQYDLYPVSVTATDTNGNQSTAGYTIAVSGDQDPVVVEARQARDAYFPRDTVRIDVQARDDLAVAELVANYYLDGSSTSISTQARNVGSAPRLIPARNVQSSFELDLSAFALSNAEHNLRVELVAVDSRGHRSNDSAPVFAQDIAIRPDVTAPLLGINNPIPGSTLYHGNAVTIGWRAVDDSQLAHVVFSVGDTEIHSRTLSQPNEEGSFTWTAPESGDIVQIDARARDIYGLESVTSWTYTMIGDEPPTVTIRTPAAGSRLAEGEAFTLAAEVNDNREVTSATFFIERSGVVEFSRNFTAQQIAAAHAQGTYLTAAMRVPHRPEAGEGELRIGVRAVDNAGLTAESLLELDILDDREPPHLQMAEPDENFSIMPGDMFSVRGSGDDNFYIDDIVPVLVDASGTETVLDWETFSRRDRVESVTIPNPATFGSLIVGERFYTDFQGSIRIPQSFISAAGQTFAFKLRAADNGVNRSETPGIDLTILGDEAAPVVTIASPLATVYDRQPLQADVTIADNVELESYRIYLADQAGQALAEATGVGEAEVRVNGVAIDLSRFAPVPPEGVSFNFVVDAVDTSGNDTHQVHRVTLLPDSPPVLSVIDELPNGDQLQGDLARHALRMADDYATSAHQVRYFPIYTSLKGLGAGGSRDPTGVAEQRFTPGGTPILPAEPAVAFGYPEAGGLAAALMIDGRVYFSVENDLATIRPLAVTTAGNVAGRLLLNAGSGHTVRYRIVTYSDAACSAMVAESSTADPLGVDLDSLLGPDITVAMIYPEILDLGGSVVPGFINAIRIDAASISAIDDYALDGRTRTVPGQPQVSLLLKDQSQGQETLALLAARMAVTSSQPRHETGLVAPIPMHFDIQEITIFGHATDRFSLERPPQPLAPLAAHAVTADGIGPQLSVASPATGMQVMPDMRFDIRVNVEDNTAGIRSLQLFENRDRLVRELGGRFEQTEYVVPYEVPHDFTGGNLELLLVATDHSGHTATQLLTFPIVRNEAPQIGLSSFSSYKVAGAYQKVLDTPERVNYGEFWVRVGEEFRIETQLTDDAGLDHYIINRVNRDGSRTQEHREEFGNSCPDAPVQTQRRATEILFEQTEPTEYEFILVDTYGNQTMRRILVHPLTNVVPGIRITTPAQDQFIVAGTFSIKVGIVAADDRRLSEQDVEVYANGVRLSLLNTGVLRADDELGGPGAIQQAYASIYDDMEQNYSVETADEYARSDSPFALQSGYILQVPSGLIRENETVTLTAIIRDSDNAVARHEITFQAAADEINPEVAITRPAIGYGPPENSDFTLGFRGYDNVKVTSLELYTAYGVRREDGSYTLSEFGAPRAVVTGIADRDHEPVTTINIDTPEFLRHIHVDRITDIGSRFAGLSLSGNETFDIWVRVIARDASGNQRVREVSYPVRVDERPTLDVVSPLPGARVVEGVPLTINVNAFDDVGIDSLRVTATHNGVEVLNRLLRQPPYTFQVQVPGFDATVPGNNILALHVEAIDSYGAAFGDLDSHRAVEDLTLEIIEDQPPSIAIGLPHDNDEVTEGDFMLVQVNGVDDVGLDRVVLQVDGLINGDRSFTDTSFPYEFLVEIPYGQAGRDIRLSASAVEQRYAGEARVATTATPTTVHVRADDIAPTLTISAPPAAGATVVERRALNFVAEASDNVRVGTVNARLFVDGNQDGQFSDVELVNQQSMTRPPYTGSLRVGTIENYAGTGSTATQLPMLLRVVATDGAGNQTTVERPVALTRNAPPQITGIQVLDERGFSLGTGVTQITEGRGIVINVIANDPEVGVDRVTLFQSLFGAGATGTYTQVGEDTAAPYQTHLTVPHGHVGETLSFRARATDIDGYQSGLSGILDLTIVADQPPSAQIVQPANDQSAVIDGQDVEVFVEALDDLGPDGIDRVVFYVNDRPVETAYNSYSDTTGSFAQEHIYRALISPPAGVDGFVIHAVVYDVVGHATRTQTVRIGQVEDTVAPIIELLSPADGDVLTSGEIVRAAVAVSDIGDDIRRQVRMQWLREAQNNDGTWTTLASAARTLHRDDTRESGDLTPVSDPDLHYYVYWDDFVDPAVLVREQGRNERVRIVTTVTTPNHEVSSESVYEVGLPVSERRYLSPLSPDPGGHIPVATRQLAKSVYYTAVAQFQGEDRTNALLGAWSNVDPMRIEQDLGNLREDERGGDRIVPRTGLFIADDTNEVFSNNGEHYIYSDLMAGASEVFAGTIGELHADANFVLAGKSGMLPGAVGGLGGCAPGQASADFASCVIAGIEQDPETGAVHTENTSGELLVFTVRNGEGQFGLPYLLQGRVDMPYPDVYGVARKDDLALVANGHGGVQVIDISDLAAPYHVGYIKPDGFTRDVRVKDGFAYIAASHQGVVVADLNDPSMPIVASLDTLGVANRLEVVGNTLYVTDMAGDGGVSQVNIISIADPYRPRLLRTVDLYPARGDRVADGSYDVTLAGNHAYVSVMYSDQEDAPAQSLIEAIDLRALSDPTRDSTVPTVIHRAADAGDFAVRGLVVARGAVQAAAGKQGINRIDLPMLTVLSHAPTADEQNVRTDLANIGIELSAVLSPATVLADHIRIVQDDPLIGLDVTDRFTLGFAQRDGSPAYRFVELTRRPDVELTPNTQYYVIVSAGLAPLTGRPLANDYVFGFATSAAGSASAPDIVSVTPSLGGIEGGTPIVVRGLNFGANPQLSVGGQSLAVIRVEAPTAEDPYERIVATTLPNYAGPAAVSVVNDADLRDTVIGAFTYVDQLVISFINPPVVHVSQTGAGDSVDVVGLGFHPDIELRVYRPGQSDVLDIDAVDNDRLTLYSAERMEWVVPDLGGDYRGFVDVEVRDPNGRRYLLPNALFYGRLSEDRVLTAELPLSEDELGNLLGQDQTYVPDALKLPPGKIVDLASDPALGFVYALGRGMPAITSDEATSLERFTGYFAPGWISLVHYQRDALENAAPM
ncbi:MAG TPA: Ig-like domain-containing protein, partial [Gammaproteobacteria bacterium]